MTHPQARFLLKAQPSWPLPASFGTPAAEEGSPCTSMASSLAVEALDVPATHKSRRSGSRARVRRHVRSDTWHSQRMPRVK